VSNQGSNAIAIGRLAGQLNQNINSIVINASGSNLPSNGPGTLTIKSIRQDRSIAMPLNGPNGFATLLYNPTTGEIIYGNVIVPP
jgi:hypothetical protein